MTSWALRIVGSGTSSTPTSLTPRQVTAFTALPLRWSGAATSCLGRRLRRAGELLHDPLAERRQVVRRPAGGDVAVGDHLLVDHLGPRVAEIGAHARPG